MSRPFAPYAAALVLALPLAAPPALASSIAVSVSDSITTAVGSVSGSIRRSSDSSSNRDDKVAEGEYRVIAVAPLPDHPGLLRVRLEPPAGAAGGELWLDLPEAAAARGALDADVRVRVRQRPYGYEFARADGDAPFFLVLDDDWQRELASRPVTL